MKTKPSKEATKPADALHAVEANLYSADEEVQALNRELRETTDRLAEALASGDGGDLQGMRAKRDNLEDRLRALQRDRPTLVSAVERAREIVKRAAMAEELAQLQELEGRAGSVGREVEEAARTLSAAWARYQDVHKDARRLNLRLRSLARSHGIPAPQGLDVSAAAGFCAPFLGGVSSVPAAVKALDTHRRNLAAPRKEPLRIAYPMTTQRYATENPYGTPRPLRT
jgi:hypothetical protein